MSDASTAGLTQTVRVSLADPRGGSVTRVLSGVPLRDDGVYVHEGCLFVAQPRKITTFAPGVWLMVESEEESA